MRIQSRRSVEFSRMAKICCSGCRYEELVASGNSETEGSDKIWPVPHMEKVFSILRRRYGLGPMDQMKHLDVNTAIRGIFLSVTLQAAVHLGRDYIENLRSSKNQNMES